MKKKTISLALFFILTGGAAGYVFAERQPHMHAAIRYLEQARLSLETAQADKGGHRVKAIELVNAAIAEVRAGIEFDNRH
jgi:hypothetical protein